MNSYLSEYIPPCTLQIKATTGASHTECFARLEDGTLKIKIAAIREDGRANKELLRYLAKEFSVHKSCVKLLSGETSERKVVEISKDIS